jgi:murein L,D-transpeptidase YcbB/YkuD
MALRPNRFKPRSSWLLAMMIAAGGVAAPMSLPAHGAAAAALEAAEANPVGEVVSSRLSEPDADPDLAAFYASRDGRPLWFQRGGKVSPEAKQFIARLRNAAADGLDPAHYQPDELTEALRRARGDREEQAAVEMMLSTALANWGADLHRAKPAAELLYSDAKFHSPEMSRREVLDRVATAPSLKAGIASVGQMNSIYMRLRAALAEEIANDGPNVAVIRANLERARAMPVDLGHRYILVDIAAQRLWAYEDGEPVDGMKVVVGRPNAPTPGMAALIRFAVFRPYWNVPPDLIAKSVAPKVVKRGLG